MNLGFDCTLLPSVSGADSFSPFVCQICNRFYHRPLLLPCSHSFCEKCVYDAAFRNYNIFVCRRCKTMFDVTRDQPGYNRNLTNAVRLVGPINTSHLWVDFKIRCMCHGDTLREASNNPVLLKNWLCLPCSRLVCLKCTSSGGDHADHKTVPALSRADFDALYMEALKASFAYNVVQQTSNELFWLLEDLKIATAKLQDYCESYNTYIDEHVSLTEGCLETVAVALKKQVRRQAADKRRRLHRCTELAAELMAEARRREAHGNILLEPLDHIHSAKAYNEAQKWLLYWVASPPAVVQLPKECPIPDPVNNKQPPSTSSEGEKLETSSAGVIQPAKSNAEVLVETHCAKYQKRVSPIGSNRPSCRATSDTHEKAEVNNKKAVSSDTRELLTGLQLPLHQQLKAPVISSKEPTTKCRTSTDSLIALDNENQSESHLQASNLPLGNSWPASKVDLKKKGKFTNQSATRSNDNGVVLVDAQVPPHQTPLSPIGTKRFGSRSRTGNNTGVDVVSEDEQLILLGARKSDGKREVLVGIELPIHQNILFLRGNNQTDLNSITDNKTQIAPVTGKGSYLQTFSHSSKNNYCVSPPNSKPVDLRVKTEEDKLHVVKDSTDRLTDDHPTMAGVKLLSSNLNFASSVGLSYPQPTIKQNPSSIVCTKLLSRQSSHLNIRENREEIVNMVRENTLNTQSESCYVDHSSKMHQSCQFDIIHSVDCVNSAIKLTGGPGNEETVAQCNVCSVETVCDKNVRTFSSSLNDTVYNSLAAAINDGTSGSTKINVSDDGDVNESPIQHFGKKQEENNINGNNVTVDSLIIEGVKGQDERTKNELAHTLQEINQQACAMETKNTTYEQKDFHSDIKDNTGIQNYALLEESGNVPQRVMRYNRDELIKIGECISVRDNIIGRSKMYYWDKIPGNCCKKKKARVCIEKIRGSMLNCDDEVKETLNNDDQHKGTYFKDCNGTKEQFIEHRETEVVDAERIIEGLECSFVRMAWDTVESILLELRFVHSDVNWAELWHLLVTAARPDSEFRLHPSDGAHCVTTRAVHLLHIAPLVNPRIIWANWGRTHPCELHRERFSKYCGMRRPPGNVGPGLISLFPSHEKNSSKNMNTSRNEQDAVTKPEAINGMIPDLQRKKCISPEQRKDCVYADYSAVVKGGARKKVSADVPPVRTWAELVSGGPRSHCCQQSQTKTQLQNRTLTCSPSLSHVVHATEPLQGPCGSNYMSRSIVDELLHELATPEYGPKSESNTSLQTRQSNLVVGATTLPPEQYRMYCLLNSQTVDLGPCTNPDCPNLAVPTVQCSRSTTTMNHIGCQRPNIAMCGSSEQQTIHDVGFSCMPWLIRKMQPSEMQYNTTDVLTDNSLNENEMLNIKNITKDNQLKDSACVRKTNFLVAEHIYDSDNVFHHENLNFPLTRNITENEFNTNIESGIHQFHISRNDAKCQNGSVDQCRTRNLPSTKYAGESDSVNINYFEKHLGDKLTSQKDYPYLQEHKNEVKGKNTLTLADWISPGNPKMHTCVGTGGLVGRHHGRDSASSDNEPKYSFILEHLPKGTKRQPVTRNGRSLKSKGLQDETKSRSRGSSADQTERASQQKLRVSKAKIRKEQRILRQSQKKPWSTGRKSCDLKDESDSNKEEIGEKEELCIEESPDEKSPEDSEDADLSTESLPVDRSRLVKGEDQEGSEQESDEEWAVGRSWLLTQGQGEGDTSADLTLDALKPSNDQGNFERTVAGDAAGSEASSSCSTASVTPEMLDFFRNHRKGRLGSSKSTRADHRRIQKERQVKKTSNGFGKKI